MPRAVFLMNHPQISLSILKALFDQLSNKKNSLELFGLEVGRCVTQIVLESAVFVTSGDQLPSLSLVSVVVDLTYTPYVHLA